ncbi:MAG: transposase [Betaproteobacteria bacterium]
MTHAEVKWPVMRKRGRYSNEFKRDFVAACSVPGVSVASIALANGINANVLRRWVAQLAHQPDSTAVVAARSLPVASTCPSSASVSHSTPAIISASEGLPAPTEQLGRGSFIRIAPEHGEQVADGDARLEMRLQRGDLHLVITGSSIACAAFVRSLLA